MASLVLLKDTTKSFYLYEAVKITLTWFSLISVKITGIATDGTPVMVIKKKGFIKSIEDKTTDPATHVWWSITASYIKKIYVRKL